MTPDPTEIRRDHVPIDRCTRVANELLDALDVEKSYREGDRVIVLVIPEDGTEASGIGMRGYHTEESPMDDVDERAGDVEAVTDMFLALRAVLRTMGKDLAFGAFEQMFVSEN